MALTGSIVVLLSQDTLRESREKYLKEQGTFHEFLTQTSVVRLERTAGDPAFVSLDFHPPSLCHFSHLSSCC